MGASGDVAALPKQMHVYLLQVSSHSAPVREADAAVTVSVNYWLGIAAPANLPRPIGDAVRAALQKAMQSPGVKEKFHSLAIVAAPDLSAQAMRAAIEADFARWGSVVRERNITVN